MATTLPSREFISRSIDRQWSAMVAKGLFPNTILAGWHEYDVLCRLLVREGIPGEKREYPSGLQRPLFRNMELLEVSEKTYLRVAVLLREDQF